MAYATNNDHRLAKLAREMLSEVDLRILKIHELGSADGGTLELLQCQKPASSASSPQKPVHRVDDDLGLGCTQSPSPQSSPQQEGPPPGSPFSTHGAVGSPRALLAPRSGDAERQVHVSNPRDASEFESELFLPLPKVPGGRVPGEQHFWTPTPSLRSMRSVPWDRPAILRPADPAVSQEDLQGGDATSEEAEAEAEHVVRLPSRGSSTKTASPPPDISPGRSPPLNTSPPLPPKQAASTSPPLNTSPPLQPPSLRPASGSYSYIDTATRAELERRRSRAAEASTAPGKPLASWRAGSPWQPSALRTMAGPPRTALHVL